MKTVESCFMTTGKQKVAGSRIFLLTLLAKLYLPTSESKHCHPVMPST